RDVGLALEAVIRAAVVRESKGADRSHRITSSGGNRPPRRVLAGWAGRVDAADRRPRAMLRSVRGVRRGDEGLARIESAFVAVDQDGERFVGDVTDSFAAVLRDSCPRLGAEVLDARSPAGNELCGRDPVDHFDCLVAGR
ncbi:MAG: hypothetical protein ACI8TL_001819, partial [Natronomonas sp.]